MRLNDWLGMGRRDKCSGSKVWPESRKNMCCFNVFSPFLSFLIKNIVFKARILCGVAFSPAMGSGQTWRSRWPLTQCHFSVSAFPSNSLLLLPGPAFLSVLFPPSDLPAPSADSFPAAIFSSWFRISLSAKRAPSSVCVQTKSGKSVYPRADAYCVSICNFKMAGNCEFTHFPLVEHPWIPFYVPVCHPQTFTFTVSWKLLPCEFSLLPSLHFLSTILPFFFFLASSLSIRSSSSSLE